MVNLVSGIKALQTLVGSQARVTLKGRQLLEMAQKKGVGEELTELLSGVVKRHPNLSGTVAYKASEQGFTVGVLTLKDGKKVVGNIAASVTGVGTKNPVVKSRVNIGENGGILRTRSFVDYAKPFRYEDIEMSSALKRGVTQTSVKVGDFGRVESYADMKKLAEALGLKDAGKLFIEKMNSYINIIKLQGRRLVAGEEVDFGKVVKTIRHDMERPSFSRTVEESIAPEKKAFWKDIVKFIKKEKSAKTGLDEVKFAKKIIAKHSKDAKVAVDDLKATFDKYGVAKLKDGRVMMRDGYVTSFKEAEKDIRRDLEFYLEKQKNLVDAGLKDKVIPDELLVMRAKLLGIDISDILKKI